MKATQLRTWFAAAALLALPGLLSAGEKNSDWVSAEVRDAEFQIRLIRDTGEIGRLFGSDLDGEFIVAEVKVQPLYGAKVKLDRADFLLRSFAGNETSAAQSPSRIAGSAVLALGTQRNSGTKVFSQGREGVILGDPTGQSRPRRVDGLNNTIGSSGVSESKTTVEQRQGEENTLEGRLAALEMPLSGEDKPFGGYLYFQLNPKHKLKHLSLSYSGAHGEFRVPFKD